MRSLIPMKRTGRAIVIAVLAANVVACGSWSRTQRGAAIGGAGGAAIGAAIGKKHGSTALGAIVGAAVGGTVGAMIGREMDRQARELAMEIPGATVERVGEGIIVTFDSGILFDFDSDQLRPEARQNLANLAASLQKYPRSNVLLVGHTDSIGSDAYNQALSERRARAAMNYLVSQGVAAARITAVGRGETEPVADNETEAGRQANRRVEVAIFASEEYRRELSSGI
ncbi:MAG TPA: OmpA family protein [Longimicrobiales bacterium]|nr:OmpA family protein [Longimicrobiales bacterium]